MTYAIECFSQRIITCGRNLNKYPIHPLETIDCMLLSAAFMLNCESIDHFKQAAEVLAADDPDLALECQRLFADLDYVEHHILFLKDLAPWESRRREMLAAAKALKRCAASQPEHAQLLRRVVGELERWWSSPTT